MSMCALRHDRPSGQFVCKRFLPHPLPALLLAPFFVWYLALATCEQQMHFRSLLLSLRGREATTGNASAVRKLWLLFLALCSRNCTETFAMQATKTLDSNIHRIRLYPVEKAIGSHTTSTQFH